MVKSLPANIANVTAETAVFIVVLLLVFVVTLISAALLLPMLLLTVPLRRSLMPILVNNLFTSLHSGLKKANLASAGRLKDSKRSHYNKRYRREVGMISKEASMRVVSIVSESFSFQGIQPNTKINTFNHFERKLKPI